MPASIVSFSGRSVAIEYDVAEGRDVVEFLFQDVVCAEASDAHVTLRIDRDPDNDGALNLLHDGQKLYSSNSLAEVANSLMSITVFHLIDKCSQGMALHAGALSRDGKGIVLPGRSGSGKSSLAAWLTARGYNYLTDELICIREHSWTVDAFPRPISIKAYGLNALDGAIDLDAYADRVLSGSQVTMIPYRLLNPDNHRQTPPLSLLLFPNYRKESDLELVRLSKGQAGLALMECLANARNLAGHGFGEVARIGRNIPAYRLTYGSFNQLTDLIDTLTGSVPESHDRGL